ncbi:Uncharacterized protein GBIM_00970 [Gryllus bimaculatus]|nr:Uncharacterized protein GBIM_00970 [Gryllus bimaculatus]
MSDTHDNANVMKLEGRNKKRGTSKGKKVEKIVHHTSTSDTGELTSSASEIVVTAMPKDSACSYVFMNPRDLEVKCSIVDLSESCDDSSNSECIDVENCHQSGNPKELKNQKHQVKEPHNSASSKISEKKLLKRLEINQFTNFMKDFDPEKSQREARKLENLPFPEKKEKKKPHNDNRLYDENGIYIETGEDLCDCLIEDCPGCHFPCHKCRSLKCGHACRRNRTWCYDEIEIEGTGVIIKRKK